MIQIQRRVSLCSNPGKNAKIFTYKHSFLKSSSGSKSYSNPNAYPNPIIPYPDFTLTSVNRLFSFLFGTALLISFLDLLFW